MPTRSQIRNATPRCPGTKVGTANWQECGRLLIWKHDFGAWACEKHGLVLDPQAAQQLNETPA